MSNKSSGNAFEHDLAQYMSRRGWWAHIFQDNRNGQPFDIVLAKEGKTQVGDCKVCEDDVFRLSRMEPNQMSRQYQKSFYRPSINDLMISFVGM